MIVLTNLISVEKTVQFDIDAMERELLEDQRRWQELQRRWERDNLEVRLAIEHATLQYGLAMAQMWAAALRPAFQEILEHE